MTLIEAVDWGVVGLFLQLAGLATAAVGFSRTWREFAAPGEGFFDPVTVRVGPAKQRLSNLTRRLLRRRRSVVVTPEPGHLVLHAFDARARITYGDLPADSTAAFAELHRRTQDLMTRVTNNLERFTDEIAAVRREVADLAAKLGEASAGLEQRTRRVAVGGIRLEAAGLVMVAAGTLLQSVSG